eukprot:1184102-Prorocentrum_minimum.AAC.7
MPARRLLRTSANGTCGLHERVGRQTRRIIREIGWNLPRVLLRMQSAVARVGIVHNSVTHAKRCS